MKKYFIISSILIIACLLIYASVTYFSKSSDDLENRVTLIPNPKTLNNTWVEDSAKILDNVPAINLEIDRNESTSGVEIAVVILPTIESYVPKNFAVALFNYWGIGKKGKDNGILVLHVIDQRRIEIEIGYGLEGDLPDAIVKRIIDTYALPAFKAGDFSKGHLETVKALIARLNNSSLAVDDLLVNKQSKLEEELFGQEPAEQEVRYQRTDLYDYQGKSLLQLTIQEREKLEITIQKLTLESEYYLTDEENQLYVERNLGIEKQEKAETAILLATVGFGYIGIWTLLFLFQWLLVKIIPSPDFKYILVKMSDFPIFYGAILIPILVICLGSIYIFGPDSWPVLIFLTGVPLVILNMFWFDVRLNRLSKRLLIIRSIPRKCKTCSAAMVKLSEKEDNQYLGKGQIAEEIVNSVDYDVWVCPSCDANDILPFKNLNPEYTYKGTSFKKVTKCPECEFETFVSRSSVILEAASYQGPGKVEVKRKCANCEHTTTEIVKIPKKQKSSSGSSSSGGGSSGSFGGGSSGGGGAGGSY